mgnify:CR=1 FL=1
MAHNNDLNGFRSGITEEHEQFQSGMAARTDSYLQNVASVKEGFTDKLDVIKDHIGQAETMLKGGLESEAGVVGSHIAGKVAVGAYRYIKGTHDIHGNMTDEYKQSIRDAASKSDAPTDTANDPTSPVETNKPSSVQPIEDAPTAPSNSSVQVLRSRVTDQQFGFKREMNPQLDGQAPPKPQPSTEQQLDQRVRKQVLDHNRGGETKEQPLEEHQRESSLPGRNQGEAGTEDGSTPSYQDPKTGEMHWSDNDDEADDTSPTSVGDSASGSGNAGTGGSSSSLDNLGNVGDDGVKAAADALATASEAAGDAALDAAATAFSWVPFLGEVLGAGAAIAGIATAVVGGVNTIVSDNQENATQSAADAANAAAAAARPQQVASNYAGGYVAPTSSSIQQ